MESPHRSEELPSSTDRPDVLIVGGGLAGVCAAISAAESGASVVILDRFHGGGSSAASGGVIYAGGGTRQQKEAGFGDDTHDNMFRYLKEEVGDTVDEATLRSFCEESAEHLEWLESHGVRFDSALSPFRTSYPTSGYNLYFSGNEKAYPFSTLAKPAPRGHRVMGSGTGGMNMTGGDLWRAVFESAIRLGVTFMPASKVEEPLLDSSGRINGVRYRAIDKTSIGYSWHESLAQKALELHQMSAQPFADWVGQLTDYIWNRSASERTIYSCSVILAAGGFVANKEMTRSFVPWADRVAALGTAGDDGSGIRLGQSLGGAISNINRISAWRLMYPPEAFVEGIVLSPAGERIAPEDLYGATLAEAMIDKADGRGYLILDSTQWDKAKSQVGEQTQMPWKGLIMYLLYWAHWRAATIGDLAGKLGVDPDAMRATVNAYNDTIVRHRLDPLRKLNYRSIIAEGPFYAIDISLAASGPMMVPAMTLGGLQVDSSSGLVLGVDGEPIPGLYAVGKNAAGVSSNRYVSGLALADCVFSGRRAGKHAAETYSNK